MKNRPEYFAPKTKFNYQPIRNLADHVTLQGEQKTYYLPGTEPGTVCNHAPELLSPITTGGFKCRCGKEFH